MDVRFPNEAEYVRSRGGLVLLVPGEGLYGTGAEAQHESESLSFEADMDVWEFIRHAKLLDEGASPSE